MKKSVLREFIKFLLIYALSATTILIGGYGGHLMAKEDTSLGWNIWGLLLFLAFIIGPLSVFWMKTLTDLFEDEV
jgi:hypothetical protein